MIDRDVDLTLHRGGVHELSRGRKPSCTAWRATEKEPEITACEAITVAIVARTTIGHSAQCGTIWKKG